MPLAAWETRQYKTYCAWLHHILSLDTRSSEPIEEISLEKDLSDGSLLIRVVEILTREPVRGKITRKNMSRIQKLSNLHALFEHMKKKGCDPGGVSIESICDGNVKQILGFLWVLLLNFQIRKTVDERLTVGDAAEAAEAARRSGNMAGPGERVSRTARQQQNLIQQQQAAAKRDQRRPGGKRRKKLQPTSTATAMAALEDELYSPRSRQAGAGSGSGGSEAPVMHSEHHVRATRSARDDLLARANELMSDGARSAGQDPPPTLTSFRRGLSDGKALKSLIAAVRPDLAQALPAAVPLATTTDAQQQSPLALAALDMLHEQFGVPKLISADDLISGNIDEQSVMAFVAMSMDALDAYRTAPTLAIDESKTNSTGQVKLTWVDPPTSNHIREYEVQRVQLKTNEALGDVNLNECQFETICKSTTASHIDNLLFPDCSFLFRVRACYSVGFSSFSNAVRYPASGTIQKDGSGSALPSSAASSAADHDAGSKDPLSREIESAIKTAGKLYSTAYRAMNDPLHNLSLESIATDIDELVKRARAIATSTDQTKRQQRIMEATRVLVDAGEGVVQVAKESPRTSPRFKNASDTLLSAVDGFVQSIQPDSDEAIPRPNKDDYEARAQLNLVLTKPEVEEQAILADISAKADSLSSLLLNSLSEFPTTVDAMTTAAAVEQLVDAAFSGSKALQKASNENGANRARDTARQLVEAADEYLSSAVIATNHPDTPRTRTRFNNALESMRFCVLNVLSALKDQNEDTNNEITSQANKASSALADTQKETPNEITDQQSGSASGVEHNLDRAEQAAQRIKNSVSSVPNQVNTHGVANAVHSLVYEAQAAANDASPAKQQLLLTSCHALLTSAQDYLKTVALCAERSDSSVASNNLKKKQIDVIRATQHVLRSIKGTGPQEIEKAAKQAQIRLRAEHDLINQSRSKSKPSGNASIEQARAALGKIHANKTSFTELVDPLAIADAVHELLENARELAISVPSSLAKERLLGLSDKVAVAAEQYVQVTGEAALDPSQATQSLWKGRARTLEDTTHRLMRALVKQVKNSKEQQIRDDVDDVSETQLAASILAKATKSFNDSKNDGVKFSSTKSAEDIVNNVRTERNRLLAAMDAPTDALSIAAATVKMVNDLRDCASKSNNDQLQKHLIDQGKTLLETAKTVVDDVKKGINGQTENTDKLLNTANKVVNVLNCMSEHGNDEKAIEIATRSDVDLKQMEDKMKQKIQEVITKVDKMIDDFDGENKKDEISNMKDKANDAAKLLITEISCESISQMDFDGFFSALSKLCSMTEFVCSSSETPDFSSFLSFLFRDFSLTCNAFLSCLCEWLDDRENKGLVTERLSQRNQLVSSVHSLLVYLFDSQQTNAATETDKAAAHMRLSSLAASIDDNISNQEKEKIKAASSSLPSSFSKLQKTHNPAYSDPLSVVEGTEEMINQTKLFMANENDDDKRSKLIEKANDLVQSALAYIDASLNAAAEPWRDDFQLEFESAVDELSSSASVLANQIDKQNVVDRNPPPKKRKKRIKWADDEGGSLEHILGPAQQIQENISGVPPPSVDVSAVLQLVKSLVLEGKKASENAASEEDKLIIKDRCQALSSAAKRFVNAIHSAATNSGNNHDNEMTNANIELAQAVRGLRSCFGPSPAEELYEKRGTGTGAQPADDEGATPGEIDSHAEKQANAALANLDAKALKKLQSELQSIVDLIMEPLPADEILKLQEMAANSGEETRSWAKFLIERNPIDYVSKSIDIFQITKHIGHELRKGNNESNVKIWQDLKASLEVLLETTKQYIDAAINCVSGPKAHTRATLKPFMDIHGPLVENTREYLENLQRALDSFALLCDSCGEKIVGEYMKTQEEQSYHKHCFVCFVCKQEIKKYLIVDSLIYCPEHVPKTGEDIICAYCNEAIKGDYMEAMGKSFHNEHFKCAKCDKILDGPYGEVEGKAYCESCKEIKPKTMPKPKTVTKNAAELKAKVNERKFSFLQKCEQLGLSKTGNIPDSNESLKGIAGKIVNWAKLAMESRIAKAGPPIGDEKGRLADLDNEFEMIGKLGTGTFGRVFLGRHKRTEKLYAIKHLNKAAVVRGRQDVRLVFEKEAMVNNCCPFLLRLEATYQDFTTLYLITEYIPGGELFRRIRKANGLPVEEARFYAAEVFVGLACMHSLSYIYRDLKPENTLIDAKGHIRICDFGFAIRTPTTAFSMVGTSEYMPPEMILGRGSGASGDWWSLGVLVYEMIVGKAPFRNTGSKLALYEDIVQRRFFPLAIEDRMARSFVNGLLDLDPMSRLGGGQFGASEIAEHPFFASIDWKKCTRKRLKPPWKPLLSAIDDTSNFDIAGQNFNDVKLELTDIGVSEDVFKDF